MADIIFNEYDDISLILLENRINPAIIDPSIPNHPREWCIGTRSTAE